MKSIFIASMTRSPIGRMGGTLATIAPEDLMRDVMVDLVLKSAIDPRDIDEVIIGQTKQSADAPNIARLASLKASFPVEVPAYTIHRQCSSGLQAIINAVWQMQAGYGDLILSGGVESMSNAPFYLRNARYGYKAGNGILVDSNTESQPKSQPEEIYGLLTMGMTAENIAEKYHITREEQDEFAYNSQIRALEAIKNKKFANEITPIVVKNRKNAIIFDEDEYPRKDVTLDQLAKLKPVFKHGGSVTAGNSSGRNDGAAVLSLMTEESLAKYKLEPLVKFVSAGIAGVNPSIMGIGPVPATKEALKRANLRIQDIGLIEINEAFASQTLAVIKELDLNPAIVNVNGGAIALGHPLGCSGTRISITLVNEMIRRNVKYGLATICVAGGLGVSVIFENLNA